MVTTDPSPSKLFSKCAEASATCRLKEEEGHQHGKDGRSLDEHDCFGVCCSLFGRSFFAICELLVSFVVDFNDTSRVSDARNILIPHSCDVETQHPLSVSLCFTVFRI